MLVDRVRLQEIRALCRTMPRFRGGKRLWSPADDHALRRTFPHTHTATVARQLRRTYTSTAGRAAKLGLHKSVAYLARHRRTGGERLRIFGARSRFPRGHVPANKGLRRPGWSPGRMKETQFKPGVPSWRTMAIGSMRLVDGYVYRKISDTPNVPWTRNWKVEHQLVWERAHGALPAGHVVVFRNSDRTDIRLENLERLTRRELMARNTVHNLPKPLAQAVQLLGALNRKIRRRTRDAEQDRRSA